jgi:hypothetical protein
MDLKFVAGDALQTFVSDSESWGISQFLLQPLEKIGLTTMHGSLDMA